MANSRNYSETFRPLSDQEFIYLLGLGRLPLEWERKKNVELALLRAKIANSGEFEARNPRCPEFLNDGFDLLITPEPDFIERAYRLVLERNPTIAETELWLNEKPLNPVKLASALFHSDEFTCRYGAHPAEAPDKASEHRILQFKTDTANWDLYCTYVSKRRNGQDQRRADKLSRLKKFDLTVGLNIFAMDLLDLERVSLRLRKYHGVNVRFEITSLANIRDSHEVSNIDLFLTNNNFLQHDLERCRELLIDSPFISACWLWDNHHLFGFSADVANCFDIIIPAHSNGQTYLHGGRAIVGSVTPCCVFQWSSSEVAFYFEQIVTSPRADELYGRFNGYPGRCGLRDGFLRQASEALHPSRVSVIPVEENKFFYATNQDRYNEIAGFKAIVCNPIYNDVPARVFDALAVGAIPIVPHGLPDLSRCFDAAAQVAFPIISYIPDNIESLRAATRTAIAAFDEGGVEGVKLRHRAAMDGHFLHHRLTAMLSELIALAKGSC
ncbi:hypothetical protein IY145_09705 [Methylosinus sp. H3A]|uniref:hypothetical protein n=1 Tax=Methylosinus sp. H3A TaxID=2785786 RepID=UPI0018C3215D|nr:hypothetical protein [Methylosinus sp. H3A]MBG0809652.1 hypothetical protein [Methylosinus sp. H3A]